MCEYFIRIFIFEAAKEGKRQWHAHTHLFGGVWRGNGLTM
jgi:hypothetical protein